MDSKSDRIQQSRPLRIGNRGFLIGLAVLALIACIIVVPHLDRPFYGLHSWAKASGAWAARSHVKYGWDYTHGMSTWAVGDPPPEDPGRYMDHPQLMVNLLALVFWVAGSTGEWVVRLLELVLTILCTWVLAMTAKRLCTPLVGLLTGLLFLMFPLTAFFGGGGWTMLAGLLAVYFYLSLIGKTDQLHPRRLAWGMGLGLSLFFMLSLGWAGLFVAMAMGVHYAGWSLTRTDRSMVPMLINAALWVAGIIGLATGFSWWFVLFGVSVVFTIGWLAVTGRRVHWDIVLPLVLGSGLAFGTNILVMLWGYDWDFGKIIALYRWRSAKGEMEAFAWGPWFATLGEYAVTNFTVPGLVVAMGYSLVVLVERLTHWIQGSAAIDGSGLSKSSPETQDKMEQNRELFAGAAPFPAMSLWFLIPFFQWFVLRGALWKHQTWERPVAPALALGGALGLVWVYHKLRGLPQLVRLLAPAALLVVILGFCVGGTVHYYSTRWQHPARISMFQKLHDAMEPDEDLLSLDPFIVNQHESKGAFYRPEIAWYLDREIVTPVSNYRLFRTLRKVGKQTGNWELAWTQTAELLIRHIEKRRAEGAYPFLLVPFHAPVWSPDGEHFHGHIDIRPMIQILSEHYPVWLQIDPKPSKPAEGIQGFRAGMTGYVIFDLREKSGPSVEEEDRQAATSSEMQLHSFKKSNDLGHPRQRTGLPQAELLPVVHQLFGTSAYERVGVQAVPFSPPSLPHELSQPRVRAVPGTEGVHRQL